MRFTFNSRIKDVELTDKCRLGLLKMIVQHLTRVGNATELSSYFLINSNLLVILQSKKTEFTFHVLLNGSEYRDAIFINRIQSDFELTTHLDPKKPRNLFACSTYLLTSLLSEMMYNGFTASDDLLENWHKLITDEKV